MAFLCLRRFVFLPPFLGRNALPYRPAYAGKGDTAFGFELGCVIPGGPPTYIEGAAALLLELLFTGADALLLAGTLVLELLLTDALLLAGTLLLELLLAGTLLLELLLADALLLDEYGGGEE